MMTYNEGDILAADVEAIVNTVNCVGVMGRGLALQFKNLYPENFRAYKAVCDKGELKPGGLFVFDRGTLEPPHTIINFATKGHWRAQSRLADIDKGLNALRQEIENSGLTSIAIPPLGCGLGGLNWDDVSPLIERALGDLSSVKVCVYPPAGTPTKGRGSQVLEAPKMTSGRAVLLVLARRYLSHVWEPQLTLLELHKLAYFLQLAGQPLRLQFAKGHYGPYAKNLRHVLHHIQGHFIDGYFDKRDQPDVEVSLRQEAVDEAQAFLKSDEATSERFHQVSQLIHGFEGAYGLELLATVSWLVNESRSTAASLVADVHAWNPRKSKFEPEHIMKAYERIQQTSWLAVAT